MGITNAKITNLTIETAKIEPLMGKSKIDRLLEFTKDCSTTGK